MAYKKLNLNYARNSLRYIIRTYQIRQLHIPYYLCDVIRHSLLKEGCKPIFYHIDDNFMPVINLDINEYILYPNYFGICDKNVEVLAEKYSNLIVDNAHSLYSKPKGFACFNTTRKFCKNNYGSELWIQKMGPQLEYDTLLKSHLEVYENNISNIEPSFVQCIKYENNNPKRLAIFKQLHKKYKKSNLLNINIDSCSSPFCYPLLANSNKDADELATKLTKQGLTIYRYWNLLPENYSEYKFYRRLVPIPLTNAHANSILQDN